MSRTLIAILAAAALAACATTPPPYAPAASGQAAGYSEMQIESNRYHVTYRAPGGADVGLLEDYALLRAAELTLQNGREWFWVDRRVVDQASNYDSGPRIGIGVGGGRWSGGGGGSVGVGINLPIGGGQRGTRGTSTTLEVRFGEGPKPDEPNAYDARAVAQNLRARTAPAG